MQLKEHQKKPFKKELQRGVIIFALLVMVFAMKVVPIPQSGVGLLFTMIVFMSFIAPIFLLSNVTLIKAFRSDPNRSFQQFVLLVFVLFVLAGAYAASTGQFNTLKFAIAGLWIVLCIFLLFKIMQRSQTSIFDYFMVLALWLPLQFSLFGEIHIPAVGSVTGAFSLLSLFLLIYAFYVIREYPMGFTFKLTGQDLRTVVLNFILFFFIMVIIGILTRLLAIADRIPQMSVVLSQLFFIYFFIALPQEFLFRGVIYRMLIRNFKGRRYAVGKALLISSILFSLARANAPIGPVIDINFGPLGIWKAPWAYMILMTAAGLFYGLVFVRTKKITAAASIHLLVEWTWLVFFSAR
jgi:membrane protease YdiL (CAAX protease family)